MIRQENDIYFGGLTRIVLVLLIGVLCLLFFLFILPYDLLYQEQMQLFLLSSDYFLSYFSKPGWLACYIGDFITQFYYFKGLGAFIITGVLGIEFLISLILFARIGKRESIFYAVIPVLYEWFLHLDPNYRLSSSISLILALLFFLLYTYFDKQRLSWIISILLMPVLYIFIGSHFITFGLLVILYDILNKRFSAILNWIVILTCCVVIPLLFREYYLLTNLQAYLYPADKFIQLLPVLLFIGLFIGYKLSIPKRSFKYKNRESIILYICILGLFSGLFVHLDRNREYLLGLDCESYFENWDKVAAKAEAYESQNETVTYFANLAWTKQNILPDKLLSIYQPFTNGMFVPVGPLSTPLQILYSGEIYYQLGDMNMAQHATMLAMIFSPQNRSSRLIKRLAEINLIIGDTAVVDKYLRMLDKTLFYSDYASDMRKIMQEGDNNPWLAEKRAYIAQYDILRRVTDAEASLTMLVNSNPTNKAALDYLLCYHLLNKNIPAFFAAYNKWYKEKEYPLPRLYAEGLLIGLTQQKASAKQLESYNIPNEITVDFMTYTKRYEEAAGEGSGLQEEYGKSYWFYYHYAQMTDK